MKLISVNVAEPRDLAWDGESVRSGIFKRPVNGSLFLTKTGFAEDTQVDTKAHGGPEKAACVFSFDHYSHWNEALSRQLEPGAFGENLTISGVSEADTCIGDTFTVGDAVVQVVQPREPCHKLAKKFQLKDIGPRLLERGHTGFYFRVLKEGVVAAGDELTLTQRDALLCSILFMNSIQWSGFYKTPDLAARAERLLQVESLPDRWREICGRKLEEARSDIDEGSQSDPGGE